MWIGERITENGIGNGISLLIFAGIVSNVAHAFGTDIYLLFVDISQFPVAGFIGMIVVFVVLTVGVVFVDLGERRVPVQYAKRVVGRKMYGGQSTHIPLKINASGVLPLIFASAIMQFPSTIFAFFPNASGEPVVERQRERHVLGLPGHTRPADHRLHVLLFFDLLQPR